MRGLAKAVRIGLGTLATLALCSTSLVPTAVAKDLTTPLPRQPLMPVVVAVSGPHILMRAERSFRITHDSGKTWAVANVPCPSYPDYCYPTSEVSDAGRVSGGIIITDTPTLKRYDAYSLIADAPVGSSYTLQSGESVISKAGGLLLLQAWPSRTYSVRSLLDGSVRDIALPAESYPSLLGDGSVIYLNPDTQRWYRVRPDGNSLELTSASANGELSGNLVAYVTGAKVCVLNLDTAATTCRGISGKFFFIRAFNASGVLIDTTKNSYVWYPLSGGKLGAPHNYAKLMRAKGIHYDQEDGENGAVVTVKSTPAVRMYLFKANGKVTIRKIPWATRAAVPASLALTPTSVVGGGATTDFSIRNWIRPVTSTIGAARTLPGSSGVAASGARLATFDQASGRMTIYDRGIKTATGKDWGDRGSQVFSGANIFDRSSCRDHVLVMDEDCESTSMLHNAKGKQLTLPGAASGMVMEDIFGDLGVLRTGDTTVSSRTLTVLNVIHPSQPNYAIELPDPGTGGFYTDVRLWGDWVAASLRPATDGEEYPVVVNYRTGAVYTGPVKSRVVALSDGFVVSRLPHSSTLSVWNFLTGTSTQLASTARIAAVDGPRLVYVASGKLVLTTVADTGRTAPRVLSVVTSKSGSRTWKLAIDVTKKLAAGTVSVTNSSGVVVARIKVGKTKANSLRGITWNGKTTSGAKAPAGRYTFRLNAAAADGSGSVGDVYGGGDPIAAVTIS
ncbi:MAG: hypothetical protein LWW77_00240 [Propionibacteriales bacterium]|nr:hypothetical protein [Propionibacteriales bacterium]